MKRKRKPRQRDSHIFAKEDHGHYVEPSWCSERLFQVERFGSPQSLIYDPACGWGTITRAARVAGYPVFGSDIINRRRHYLGRHFARHDFLKTENGLFGRTLFSIVCNPPFDHVEEFCTHALDIGARKVAMIFLLRRLPAAHWLEKLPLRTIYLLTPRPSMPPGSYIMAGNKPGGGKQDFCWLVFDAIATSGGPVEMKWLHKNRTELDE